MNKKQLRILIAPLDWGLGHVTRCLPLMQHILSRGHQLIFAGNNSQQRYVQTIFPSIEYLYLEGYNVAYARTKSGLIPKIIAQVPRLRKRIKNEHLWLQEIIRKNHIDAVISDNRYGLYSTLVPCIFMTHQLQIRSGYSNYVDMLLLRFHYKFIEKFSNCWVVDTEKDNGLSGTLAHPRQLPCIKTVYIGLLSQCAGKNKSINPGSEFYVLVLLSGTEPQRTILSDILWKKAIKLDKPVIFVAGSEEAETPELVPEHISFHKRLSAEDLLIAIDTASIVICRSGYSSLMDLIALDKKAILIPTPGQTEQEYLAKRMHGKKVFLTAAQQKFDIETSLINASLFPFAANKFGDSFHQHQEVVDQLLDDLG